MDSPYRTKKEQDMTVKTSRHYRGNHPDILETDWDYVYRLKDEQGFEFSVYRREQEHSDEWSYYKVCANGRVPRKANYWLAHNKLTGSVGFTRDLASMRQHRPRLYEGLMDALEEMSGQLPA